MARLRVGEGSWFAGRRCLPEVDEHYFVWYLYYRHVGTLEEREELMTLTLRLFAGRMFT